jgi:hypothetical protein
LVANPRPFRSVENTGDFFSAYCALTPLDRAALIGSLIGKAGALDNDSRAPMSSRQMREQSVTTLDALYHDNLANLKGTLAARFPAGQVAAPPATPGNSNYAQPWAASELIYQRYVLVERNRNWLAQLPGVLASERLPFYAIGVAHFADGPHGPGLITLLREAGYRVSLIDGDAALNAVLARVPARSSQQPVPQSIVAQPLYGQCRNHVGDPYLCAWKGATTSYQLIAMPGSGSHEFVQVCYQREGLYGPLTNCVAMQSVASAERAAELAVATGIELPPEKP